jgi:hypothetical protein
MAAFGGPVRQLGGVDAAEGNRGMPNRSSGDVLIVGAGPAPA